MHLYDPCRKGKASNVKAFQGSLKRSKELGQRCVTMVDQSPHPVLSDRGEPDERESLSRHESVA
jgi:hypothetical protein